MSMSAAQILSEITIAFPARRNAPFDPIANSIQGDEPLLTANAFADKDDWTILDGKWLDECPDGWATALNFLSDEAVCFYIPAFIAADIRGEFDRVEVRYHLTHGFDKLSFNQPIYGLRGEQTWTSYGRRRWSHLSVEQARVIVHYLEWCVAERGLTSACGEAEALAAYWYDRANAQSNGS